MANTSPIIDLVGINDLQARVAALESALGYYNAANAVLSATAAVDGSTGGGGGTVSSGIGSIIGSYSPSTDVIQYGAFFVATNKPAGAGNIFSFGTRTITFPTPFVSVPNVVLTAFGAMPNTVPLTATVTLGDTTTTGFRCKVINLDGNFTQNIGVSYIAIGKKA